MSLSGNWYYGLVLLGVVAVFVILIYVAWRALFGDKRNRSRRRCPRCWYDLAYSPGMTCGECGFTAERESQLHQVRRRYRLAAAAIAGCVVLAVFINEQTSQTGWAAALPTRALIWMMPLGSGPNNAISREITTRAAMGKLTASDWAAVIDRCANGDMINRPTSAGWRAKYGNFIWSWRQRLLGDRTIDARLNSIEPWIDVTSRDTWPAGSPVMLQVDVKDWWSWGMECRVRVTPRIGETPLSEARTFRRTGDDRIPRRGFTLALPAMNESEVEVSLDVEISRRTMTALKLKSNSAPNEDDAGADASMAAEDSWETVATQTVTRRMRIEPPERSALAALEGDPSIDAMIANVFGGGTVKWNTGLSIVRVRVDQRSTADPQLNDVAIGLHVDLLCDGQLARRLNLWWLGGSDIDDTNYGYEIEFEDLDALRTAGTDASEWKMRITGDESLALRAAGGTKVWKGEIVLPMKVQSMPGESPARAWWREE